VKSDNLDHYSENWEYRDGAVAHSLVLKAKNMDSTEDEQAQATAELTAMGFCMLEGCRR
jgi:hypothetical protein